MSFRMYPDCADSEIDVLGRIPRHWMVSQLKRVIEEISSGTSVNATDSPATDHEFGVLKTSCVYTREFNPKENKTVDDAEHARLACPLKTGTLIVSRMNTPELVGAAGYVSSSPSNLFLPDRLWQVSFNTNAIGKFIHYWSKSDVYADQIKRACAGTSASMQNIDRGEFGSLLLAIPPVQEQTQIARFLDHETAKIDALIREQERLIELLQEKRQAVISQAVTKGLDPTAPMKDSGVEWLGQVPAHWEVSKFKWHTKTTSGGTPPTGQQNSYYDGDIPWLRTLDLNNSDLHEASAFVTDAALSETSCCMVPPGSVLIAMYGGDGTIGKNALLKFDSAINQAICAFLPSTQVMPEFLFEYIQFYRPFWMIGAESSRKDPNIGQDRIGDHPIVIPPVAEQDSIAKVVSRRKIAFEKLIGKAAETIQLLRERRAALISAAVTGKIDVREWGAITNKKYEDYGGE